MLVDLWSISWAFLCYWCCQAVCHAKRFRMPFLDREWLGWNGHRVSYRLVPSQSVLVFCARPLLWFWILRSHVGVRPTTPLRFLIPAVRHLPSYLRHKTTTRSDGKTRFNLRVHWVSVDVLSWRLSIFRIWCTLRNMLSNTLNNCFKMRCRRDPWPLMVWVCRSLFHRRVVLPISFFGVRCPVCVCS